MTGTPNSEAVFAALAPILRRLCQNRLTGLAPETILEELPGLDSLRLIEAMALLEDRFEVEIDTDALGGLRNVADIVKAIATGKPKHP